MKSLALKWWDVSNNKERSWDTFLDGDFDWNPHEQEWKESEGKCQSDRCSNKPGGRSTSCFANLGPAKIFLSQNRIEFLCEPCWVEKCLAYSVEDWSTTYAKYRKGEEDG